MLLLLQSLARPSANCFVTLPIKTASPNNLWICPWWRYVQSLVEMNDIWDMFVLNKNDLSPRKTFKLKKMTLKIFSTTKLRTKCRWFFVNQLFSSWTFYDCPNFCFSDLFPTRTLVIVRNSWKVLILHNVWFYWLKFWGCWPKPLPTTNSTLK